MNYIDIIENPTIISQLKSKDTIELSCSTCYKKYIKTKHYIKSKIDYGVTKNYCSVECSNTKDKSKYTSFNCTNCETPNTRLFSSLMDGNNFCNHSCAATYNNTNRNRKTNRKLRYRTCKQCNCTYRGKTSFCSKVCILNCFKDQRKNKVLSGTATPKMIKQFLIETNGHKCSKCHLSEWNCIPIPIELDHIDGNSENNALSNCCLLCPNCHAQTPTYKGKNIGNGRYNRRIRYAESKSY